MCVRYMAENRYHLMLISYCHFKTITDPTISQYKVTGRPVVTKILLQTYPMNIDNIGEKSFLGNRQTLIAIS